MSERAAFLAQKVAIDYCRGKTGSFSHSLFKEKPFRDALEVCRWESFAATLADLLILAEGVLRPRAQIEGGDSAKRVADALAAMYPSILADYPLPTHRAGKDWSDVEAEFAIRFAAARNAASGEPARVARHSAGRLFATLPIHTSMRELDEEIVHGAVLFRMVAIHQELTRRADPPALVRALAAR
ncbi:MAG: hypothetical protein FJX42_01875 [Alphaproteobacteria bacterium]|nr:hypothetical protein [Alphaproteobacteria bacterium]